jgi:transcriptional regulator with XRE-family HTH domain
MQSIPEICKHRGILTHWKGYPEGSVERAKSLGIEVWSTSKRLDTTLNLWQTELSVLQREKPWKALGLKSADDFVKAVVGKSTKEISKEITKRTQIQKLRKEHPEWTQQQIAEEVNVDKAYVSRVLTNKLQCNNTVNAPEHIKTRPHQADFRKLPPELQAKVASREISLNQAAIQAGIRRKPSDSDTVLKAFTRAQDRVGLLRDILSAFIASDRDSVPQETRDAVQRLVELLSKDSPPCD